MTRSWVQISLLGLLIAAVLSMTPDAWAVDSKTAVRAANLWTRIQYPGDTHEEFERAQHVQAADLDNDGRDEVIYLHRIPCDGGGSFDCTNSVTVLRTPISPNSEILNTRDPFVSMFDDSKQTLIELGYEYDASLHIPGEVERVVIVGRTIRVTFIATRESHACLRKLRDHYPEWRMEACPALGRYVWTLKWTPGKLTSQSEKTAS